MSRQKILLPSGAIIERVPHFRVSMIMNSVCTIQFKGRTIRCRRAFHATHAWHVDASFYVACGYPSEFWEV